MPARVPRAPRFRAICKGDACVAAYRIDTALDYRPPPWPSPAREHSPEGVALDRACKRTRAPPRSRSRASRLPRPGIVSRPYVQVSCRGGVGGSLWTRRGFCWQKGIVSARPVHRSKRSIRSPVCSRGMSRLRMLVGVAVAAGALVAATGCDSGPRPAADPAGQAEQLRGLFADLKRAGSAEDERKALRRIARWASAAGRSLQVVTEVGAVRSAADAQRVARGKGKLRVDLQCRIPPDTVWTNVTLRDRAHLLELIPALPQQ